MILEAVYAGAVAWILIRVVRQYRSFAGIGPAKEPPTSSIAVIIPVRNEQENIGPCLKSFAAQEYAGGDFEVLVVNDNSTDATRERIGAYLGAGVRLIDAPPLPPGWTGKCHACWQGASRSGATWLCFVDADVRAAPTLLRDSVAHAEATAIDMLSLEPFQELGGIWERLILPAGFLLLGATQDLRAVNDPHASRSAANGQFILIRRSAYLAMGGHAAVRGAVAEDGALAARVKASGDQMSLLDGEGLLRVRMYRLLGALWEGLAKNIPQMLHGMKPAALAAVLAIVLAVASVALPVLAAVGVWEHPDGAAWASLALALGASLALLMTHVGIARHFRFPAWYAILFPAGYLLGAALVVTSIARQLRGRVTWKGRTYAPRREIRPRARAAGAGSPGPYR